MTTEQRCYADNGIWLCQNCAKLVDNDEASFPTKLLSAWKTIREHNALMSIGRTIPPQNETEAQRKLRKVIQWKGKQVMLVKMANSHQAMTLGVRPWVPTPVTLLDCEEFFVKVKGAGWDQSRSIPMKNIELGHNDKFDCLELLEYD
jgi:hypothetical protein